MLGTGDTMNKIAFITGASKGIGKSLAVKFASSGYNLILHYNTSFDSAVKLKEELESNYGVIAYLVKADFNSYTDIDSMVLNIKEYTDKIDVLVNNASYSCDCDVEDKTGEQFNNVLNVNLVAPFLIVKGLSSIMNNGTIINISSTDADSTGSVYNIDYSASKAGINSMTKILSMKFPNIRFYVVSPNWVNTESIREMDKDYLLSELKRVGQNKLIEPDEVADVVFNLINDSSLTSGSIIRIEGE